MIIKTTDRLIAKTDAYELEVYKTEGERLTVVKTYTSEEINRLTPRGMPISASRKEVVAVLKQAAKSIKAQSSPISEAAGAIRRINK
ncbi:hypothetical protein [Serratia liquefaciens]|uniref:hypothetical protein n=1 Tax=Serratia liquefaciens TaxID=614 RepID=UPI0022B965E2|nr:hypothetical protein [Serratia liquefaciens]